MFGFLGSLLNALRTAEQAKDAGNNEDYAFIKAASTAAVEERGDPDYVEALNVITEASLEKLK